MPDTTPELAWWVMTGVIAGLLSLITVIVALLAYLGKTLGDRVLTALDKLQELFLKLQEKETATEKLIAEHIAADIQQERACKERHERVSLQLAKLEVT